MFLYVLICFLYVVYMFLYVFIMFLYYVFYVFYPPRDASPAPNVVLLALWTGRHCCSEGGVELL